MRSRFGAMGRGAVAAGTFGAAVLLHAPAHADEKAACVAASEHAQVLRDDGKLKEARAELLACSRDACPKAVKKDCSTWLASVEASLPTIVLGAVDADQRDLIDVRVALDGKPLADTLDGKAIAVDPGPHTLRFETPSRPPVEMPLLVREGEQRREVTAHFQAAPPAAPVPIAPPPAPPPAPTRVPVAAIVVGSLGVVAFGSFAYFGITGKNELSNLHATCGVTHTCAQSDVDATHTKLLVADVSLGVGIGAVAVASGLLIYHFRSSRSASALRVDAFPVAGGGVASVGGSF